MNLSFVLAVLRIKTGKVILFSDNTILFMTICFCFLICDLFYDNMFWFCDFWVVFPIKTSNTISFYDFRNQFCLWHALIALAPKLEASQNHFTHTSLHKFIKTNVVIQTVIYDLKFNLWIVACFVKQKKQFVFILWFLSGFAD